ncbi:hypothetical protein, partial [uncultured Duncaniella sp.]|uniref:hypothetical protein n=1 Tax=uncultured Duncaniella sp. TaxID=2768039 RepID=UPI0026E5692D
CALPILGKGARLSGFNQRLSQISGMKVRTGVPVSRRLRILDGRIQVADAVDVLAILNAAAKNNPQECLSTPAPVVETPVRPVAEAKPVVTVADPTPGPARVPAASIASPVNASQPAAATTTTNDTTTTTTTYTPPVQHIDNSRGGNRSRLSALYDKMRERVANAISNSFNEEDDEE